MKTASTFIAITAEGGLLPADFLAELLSPKTAIEGLEPESYNLAAGERINEQVNRSWNRLKGRWVDFKKSIADKQPGEATTTETRDRWLHPIFQELGFGQRLPIASPIEVDGRPYSVSHGWGHVPIHLVGSHVDIDRRTPGATGAAKTSPHSLVQSVLNASDDHLWGIVSNGLVFRLLRDNVALTRLSYVEWDLAAIFDGDLYSEFFVLWLVAHQSRFDGEPAEQCRLERWKKAAEDKGLRVLENLYPGVKTAIASLGAGLVSHPANIALRNRLRTGELTTQDFYRQVLRVIYRLLFLFVAEDRGLLHVPDDSDAALKARRRYLDFYSLSRLRELTLHRAGTPHPDLWNVFQFVADKLGSDAGCPELALPALGSFLWTAARATPDLIGCQVSNRRFLEAIHALAFMRDGNVRRGVDYKNLGSEELGSVYQGLLEMHSCINADAGTFQLDVAAGNERKTTGSYYTPDSLVQCLLDSALEPVIAERLAKAKTPPEKENALLALKVCDKAAGSGHFLIRAAHRIARHLAQVRSGEDEPSPLVYRTALRDVIGHCIYGVDINPMAVELCKVTLWLEAIEPGKPLSFLDHHIRCGNSLLGATPELIAAGIPDEAYETIEGDDGAACAALKKLNKGQRENLGALFQDEEQALHKKLFQVAAIIDDISDAQPEDIHRKEAAFHSAQTDIAFAKAWDLANLWCSAFVIQKRFPASVGIPATTEPEPKPSDRVTYQTGLFGGSEKVPLRISKKAKASISSTSENPIGVTTQNLRDFAEGRNLPNGLFAEAKRLADQYQFFHWHLAFPEVFEQGGFDVNLGNPPWETMSPDAKEFFSAYNPEVRNQDKENQEAVISRLLENPGIALHWAKSRRDIFSVVHFIKNSGIYRLFAEGNLGKGDFNVFRMFVESTLRSTKLGGYTAQIVPEGLYNGANSSAIRRAFFSSCTVDCLYGFENARGIWFAGIDTRMKFCLYAARIGGKTDRFNACFNIRTEEQLKQAVRGAGLSLSVAMIHEFSPDALAIMELSDQRDIDIAQKMYARWPKLGDKTAGPPQRTYMRELDMGNDREVFGCDTGGIPLYEGRMVDQYDHRAKGYRSGRGRTAIWEELPFGTSGKSIQPQWKLKLTDVPDKVIERLKRYRVGFCDVASPTNERSLVAALLPPNVVAGDKVPTITFEVGWDWAYLIWLAVANSFTMDFLARKKISLKMSYTVLDSLPFPRLSRDNVLAHQIVPRVLRLVCCGPEMTAYWNAMAEDGWGNGVVSGERPPGVEDESERLRIRAELEVIVARDLFGLTSEELGYILESFPTVKRRDEEKFNGDYRTKSVILKIYDVFGEAIRTGQPYQTRLDPPPADPRCCHPPRTI